ncbi:hypothetical protein BOQ60_26080, partial [Chryseobacterium sp. CH1]
CFQQQLSKLLGVEIHQKMTSIFKETVCIYRLITCQTAANRFLTTRAIIYSSSFFLLPTTTEQVAGCGNPPENDQHL